MLSSPLARSVLPHVYRAVSPLASSTVPFRAMASSSAPSASTPADDSPENNILCTVDSHGFATVTLNRPERFNSFSDVVITRFSEIFDGLKDSKGVRGCFIRSTGRFFSAGADLAWMKRTATYTREQNLADAQNLGDMLSKLNKLPFPTIALVQGPSFGGGVGLVSCCDVAVAVSSAHFTLSEVKLGILPATISPYVVARIGPTQARRYFLTAERFGAEEALSMGLVHELVEDEAGLDEWAASLTKAITAASPSAVAASKDLIRAVSGREITADLITDTARRLCDQRASAEGIEGLTAFFEKRPASWNIQ